MATFAVVLSKIRICPVTVVQFFRGVNRFSVCTTRWGGQKWRISNGMANDGLAYGPLTDNPDWSYADSTPAPETKRRKARKNQRLRQSERITQYIVEIDSGRQEDNQYKGITER